MRIREKCRALVDLLPRRGWQWMWVNRWIGVYMARSSDGLWEYKGRRMRHIDGTLQRCGPRLRVLSVGIVLGEFGVSLLIDPGKFRAG